MGSWSNSAQFQIGRFVPSSQLLLVPPPRVWERLTVRHVGVSSSLALWGQYPGSHRSRVPISVKPRVRALRKPLLRVGRSSRQPCLCFRKNFSPSSRFHGYHIWETCWEWKAPQQDSRMTLKESQTEIYWRHRRMTPIKMPSAATKPLSPCITIFYIVIQCPFHLREKRWDTLRPQTL